MEPIIIQLTRIPILKSFKPSRQIELLRSGLYDSHNESFVCSPVWDGGDFYPTDDLNWDKYIDCVKNNKKFEWVLQNYTP